MLLRHAKKNMVTEYREFQFVSVPSTFRLSLLISFYCSGRDKDSTKTSFCDGCCYPENPIPPRKGMVPSLQLQGSQ